MLNTYENIFNCFSLTETIITAIFLVATLHLSSGQSRGETGVRGPIESRAEGYYRRNIPIQSQTQIQYQNSAYPSQQSQSQSFVYLSHIQKPQPEYYSPVIFNNQNPYHQYSHPQVDSSHASHPQQQPAYSNPQSSQQRPIFNSYSESTTQRPIFNNYQSTQQKPASNSYSPPFNSYKPYPPQTNSNQNVQSQQNPHFDSRIDEGSTPEPLIDDFPTRKPRPTGTRKPATTRKPPPQILNSRFDDRNSASFKKTLSYDSELSNSMEKFSLEILDQFCFKLPTENFMISPFSIYHLLVILAEGANGNTFKEISNKLELGSISRSRDFQQYLSETLK